LRRRRNDVDHYYWLTAVIAARGYQTATSRLIAAIIVGLGLIPLVRATTTAGPADSRDRLLAVAITVCCLAMSSLWSRHRWPTRTQSQLCVVGGTACIAVACLIEAQPVIGLLGSTSFAVLAAFIALFHSVRLLAFTWTVGAATVAVLAARLAAVDPALALSSVVLVALVNVFGAFACRLLLRLFDNDIGHGDIEPLTGLLNRDAFSEKIATLIGARSRSDDRYLVVAVITLDSYSLLTTVAGAAGANRARIDVGQKLRETVRRDALIAHLGDSEFLIADLFTTPDPAALIERIRGAITSPPSRMTASIGAVSAPLHPLTGHSPHDILDELLTIAVTAMFEARKSGGNQARQVLNPNLATLNHPDWPATGKPA
jgi:diguanylate cyclase (GGDEF)-like protein